MSVTLRQTIRREEIVQEIVVDDEPITDFDNLPALFERKPAKRAPLREAIRALVTLRTRAA